MTPTERDLIIGKFSDLTTLMNAHFDATNTSIDTMLKKQDITNGRVNKLEHWKTEHYTCENKSNELAKKLDKGNVGFWLWFSEKPFRLTIIAVVITIFTLKEVRDLIISLL